MSIETEPSSLYSNNDLDNPSVGHITQGLDVRLEGFKALTFITGRKFEIRISGYAFNPNYR